jgi:hypothetical protein
VHYRRSSVSALGHSFLAHLERTTLLNKKTEQQPLISATLTTAASTT